MSKELVDRMLKEADEITCYASTPAEYRPNATAKLLREAAAWINHHSTINAAAVQDKGRPENLTAENKSDSPLALAAAPESAAKWCSYCRVYSHNDSECWSTRPANWQAPLPDAIVDLDGSLVPSAPPVQSAASGMPERKPGVLFCGYCSKALPDAALLSDYDALRTYAKGLEARLREEQSRYYDTEGDGVVFCGKCGARR